MRTLEPTYYDEQPMNTQGWFTEAELDKFMDVYTKLDPVDIKFLIGVATGIALSAAFFWVPLGYWLCRHWR